jgi:hypothetical protein
MNKYIGFDIDSKKIMACVVENGEKTFIEHQRLIKALILLILVVKILYLYCLPLCTTHAAVLLPYGSNPI